MCQNRHFPFHHEPVLFRFFPPEGEQAAAAGEGSRRKGSYDSPEEPPVSWEDYPNLRPIQLKRFPLLGEIACGEPIFAQEDRETFLIADAEIAADFCLLARGDSMIGARIYDGDAVFIRSQPMVENGEIAAVIIDDEATLKRVYYDRAHARLQLVPENPAYSPLVYVGEELDNIRILGKAVGFMSIF